MKTRIIHTKLHFEDEWFNTIPIEYKYPFIYLFTNSHIGQTGIYYLTKRVALLETGITSDLWDKATEFFESEKKIGFYKNWVCVANAKKHSNYLGSKNKIAYEKELKEIPLEVINYFNDTLSIEYIYPSDSTINKKSEIINNKSEIRNQKPVIENKKYDKFGNPFTEHKSSGGFSPIGEVLTNVDLTSDEPPF